MRSARLGGVFALVAAAVFLAPAPSAVAQPAPTTVVPVSTTVFDDGVHHSVTTTLDCPPGHRLVAGGLEHAEIKTLIPTLDFRGVVASGRITDAAPNNFMTVSALCAPLGQQTDVITVSARGGPPDGQVQNVFYTATAFCPPGYYAFGGGASVHNDLVNMPSWDDSARLMESAPFLSEGNDRSSGWRASGRSSSRTTDVLTVRAQCSRITTEAAGPQTQAFAGFGEGFTRLTVTCAPGFTALGGGPRVLTTNPLPGSSVLRESTPVGTSGWSVSVGSRLPTVEFFAGATCVR